MYKFFDKKSALPADKSASSNGVKSKNMLNQELAEELHKPSIRKFEKRKVHSSVIDNILRADLTNMQLMSKFNKGICFLLCVVGIFSKYALVVPLKNKKTYYNY